ncbi:MAG TPA: hypothetical protein VFV42_12640 [Acidimicrobiales bacterium]|nr:hypothetical protein [Acidimicrobiales bacterium]
MPSRHVLAALLATGALLGGALAGCSEEPDEVEATGDERAAQARQAGLDAGLDEEVAEFLSLLARGDTATYRVRFPGLEEGTELVVRNRPPDRRVDVVADGEVVEVRQVVDGEAFTCTPDGDDERFTCERTDSLVEPPGVFRSGTLDRLREALAARVDDFTFEIEQRTVSGVAVRCLVTERRPGRDDPELGVTGTICASGEGAVLLVDQGEERIEALDYGTDVDPDALRRVDEPGG